MMNAEALSRGPGPALVERLRLPRGIAHPFAAAFLAAVSALVLAPLVSLAVLAYGGDSELWPHLAAYVIPPAAVNTAVLIAGIALVCVAAGAGTAWLVTCYDFPGRSTLLWLLPLPLAFPTYIVAYVYADLLGGVGPIQLALRAAFGWTSAADYWFPNVRSLGGAILVMGFVLYPYVYLASRAMFQTQSVALLETARGFGASPWRVAWDIALPMARPAMAAGVALALLEALNDIGASEYFGVQTLTLSIFTTWLNRSSLPGAAQIAWLMLIVVAALIALERYGRRRQSFTGYDTRPGCARRIALSGSARWLALAGCLFPVCVGFIVPLTYLAFEVIVRGLLTGFDPSLIRHMLSTVLLAGTATILVVGIGIGAAFAHRLQQGPFGAACFLLAGLGYAVPGTVLALGLLSPLVAIDEAINSVTSTLTGSRAGLVLAGSSAAIVCAYVVRFLAISTGLGQAGLARISHDLDDAARVAGTRPCGVIRSIHLPLLRPAIWAAALLVFVDCMKELPATLLLRPLNVETLSTYIYQFASRGSFEEGSLAALLIVLVGIVPVIWMTRHADQALGGPPPERRGEAHGA